jgi:antitoxin HigA-1
MRVAKVTRRKMPPVHPGAILKDDVLPALNMGVSQAAKELGLSRQTLHRILAGTLGISTESALRIGKWCGNGPSLWLRMQQAYDLWRAEQAMAQVLAGIPSHAVA